MPCFITAWIIVLLKKIKHKSILWKIRIKHLLFVILSTFSPKHFHPLLPFKGVRSKSSEGHCICMSLSQCVRCIWSKECLIRYLFGVTRTCWVLFNDIIRTSLSFKKRVIYKMIYQYSFIVIHLFFFTNLFFMSQYK